MHNIIDTLDILNIIDLALDEITAHNKNVPLVQSLAMIWNEEIDRR